MEEVEEHLAGLDEQQGRLQAQQNDLNAKDIRFQSGPHPCLLPIAAPELKRAR